MSKRVRPIIAVVVTIVLASIPVWIWIERRMPTAKVDLINRTGTTVLRLVVRGDTSVAARRELAVAESVEDMGYMTLPIHACMRESAWSCEATLANGGTIKYEFWAIRDDITWCTYELKQDGEWGLYGQ